LQREGGHDKRTRRMADGEPEAENGENDKPPHKRRKASKTDDNDSSNTAKSATVKRKQRMLKKAEREKVTMKIASSNPQEIASVALTEVMKQVPSFNKELKRILFCSYLE